MPTEQPSDQLFARSEKFPKKEKSSSENLTHAAESGGTAPIMTAKRTICQSGLRFAEVVIPVSVRVDVLCLSNAVTHLNTLSARASTFGGIVTPICFAVFKSITSSNFFGCSTGRSAGLAPLRILSTYVAARRNKSGVFAP